LAVIATIVIGSGKFSFLFGQISPSGILPVKIKRNLFSAMKCPTNGMLFYGELFSRHGPGVGFSVILEGVKKSGIWVLLR
jgi:hypothetical protein